MIANLRFVWVMVLAALVLLALAPLQLIGILLAKLGWTQLASLVPVLFHKAILKIFGVRLTLDGQIVKDRPLLLVSNHVSWLDIPVYGAIAPLCFVAKSEMSSWPLFGTMAKLQRTVFVRREDRRNSHQQANEVADRLTAREVMVLFPEGTTTDGNRLEPFKTSLFEAAKIALNKSPVETAMVQPAAIDYTHLHGLPLGRAKRPHVAWPGELDLPESFIPLVKAGALDVTIRLGEPIILTQTSNRKIIARDATNSIRTMLDSSRTGG
ncbi:MAG: 1-acyl-sn-glycerol-3-phosphate acyltransferase [Rhizobiaceae bacterium]|nr:1-acyl-sn-glycerol-3-phosphate acyltransferase [Rhizobiaceae bacterium]